MKINASNIILLISVFLSSSAHADDPIRGQMLFKTRCSTCHWIANKPNRKNKLGPNLAGLFDRKAGTAPHYSTYSKDLLQYGKPWSRETLDAFIKEPKLIAPKTKMQYSYVGLRKSEDRRDIISYLQKMSNDPMAD